jgi:hypothetical protein
MSAATFTTEQRERIVRAARDARRLGILEQGGDVVDLATETDNFFWQGLDDRRARIALRLIGLCSVQQNCRDCGDGFPYDPDADRCPSCVAALIDGGRP